MTIDVYHQSNYGRIDMYLADRELADLYRRLTGKVTLTRYDLDNLALLCKAEGSRVIANPNYSKI